MLVSLKQDSIALLNVSNISIALNLVAVINILIVCFYLFLRKNNILPNYVLAVIFIIPGLYFVDNILVLTEVLQQFPYAFFMVQILASLFPVSVYYYVHLLLTDNKPYHKILLAGSLLLFAYVCYLTLDFYDMTADRKAVYISNLSDGEKYPFSMMLYTVLFYAWQMVYFIVLVFEIKRYNTTVENSFSSFDEIKLDYIKKFMTLLGFLNFGLVIFYLVLPLPIVDYGILPSFVTLIYVFIMYYAIKHKAIFSRESYGMLVRENARLLALNTMAVLVQNKNDLDEKVKLLGKRIEEVLIHQKIYQTPDFRLDLLAEKINEPAYIVSQALNKYFNKSFYELINELRIKEAQNRLKKFDSKKETIEALAFEVGFNSRAAFYRSFKKYTGKVPKDFT